MSNSNPQNSLSDPKSWVDNYSDYLFGFAMTRVREKRLAEDLVQETFLAALKTRGNFEGKLAWIR